MIHQVRVIFGDTDQLGVVYYANYLRYFEGARAAYLRSLGRSNADLAAWGVALPVTECHCRYRMPARYEDVLDVKVEVTEIRGASLRFEYHVHRGSDLLATGFTVHASIDPERGRPRRLPNELRALIEGAAGQ